MSEPLDEQTQGEQTDSAPPDDTGTGTTEHGYSVTDLPEGAEPDPLGDASLTPEERAGAQTSNE